MEKHEIISRIVNKLISMDEEYLTSIESVAIACEVVQTAKSTILNNALVNDLESQFKAYC